jgi:hypothetical protein
MPDDYATAPERYGLPAAQPEKAQIRPGLHHQDPQDIDAREWTRIQLEDLSIGQVILEAEYLRHITVHFHCDATWPYLRERLLQAEALLEARDDLLSKFRLNRIRTLLGPIS